MTEERFNTHLELENIQGLVLSGYDSRPVAAYAMFAIEDPAAARRWLAALEDRLQFGDFLTTPRHREPRLHKLCLNIAFTYAGLERLGLGEEGLGGLHESIRVGMSDPHRSRQLGDDGDSAPSSWEWGGPKTPVVHGMLCGFAGARRDEGGDDALSAERIAAEEAKVRHAIESELVAQHGVTLLRYLPAHCALSRELRKEPFGFRDGISNPAIAGLPGRANKKDPLPSGELVLGYHNVYGELPLTSRVPTESDSADLLPLADGQTDLKDFGKNGSYLVFRQLRQDVARFWQFAHEAAPKLPEQRDPVWLASRMVGRWPDGTPVTLSPHEQSPALIDDRNTFLFSEHGDAFGARCPIGAHIRRTNPRDTLLPQPHDPPLSEWPPTTETMADRIANVNRHRIIRRGRSYGTPLDKDLEPSRMLEDDGKERGIYFLCFNTNLRRQFEFVQSTWAKNPAFAGLSKDPDPLLASSRATPYPADRFTMQGGSECPARVIRGVPRFVEVRGGGYFFMPGRAALGYLAQLGEDRDRASRT